MRTVTSAADLLQISELTSVLTHEVRGRRAPDAAAVEAYGESVPEVGARYGDTYLETRMRLQVEGEGVLILADMSAVYTHSEEVDLEMDALREFVERVGIMSVYPFVRESIFTTAARLGVSPPVLGLIRPGTFRLGEMGASRGPDEDAGPTVTPGDLAAQLGVSPAAVRRRLRELDINPGPNGRWELNAAEAMKVRMLLRES